jgi:hypothetical protein
VLDDALTHQQFVQITIWVTGAVLVVVVVGFLLFLAWAKRERLRRPRQIEIGMIERDLAERKSRHTE